MFDTNSATCRRFVAFHAATPHHFRQRCRPSATASLCRDTQLSLAAIAAVVRNLSAFEDAQVHLIVRAARERRSGTTGSAARDPALMPSQGIAATHIDSATARSKRTAELLDRVTEALERWVASLRDT